MPKANDNQNYSTLTKSSEDKNVTLGNSTIEKKSDYYEKTLKEYSRRISTVEKNITYIEKNFTQKVIEIATIFIAFFTFISGEFQLIQRFNYFQFLVFSPLFAGILISFVLVLVSLIRKTELNSHNHLDLFFAFLIPMTIAIILSIFLFFLTETIFKKSDINSSIGPTPSPSYILPTASPTSTQVYFVK
ncbi:MAG: hypothetical protein WAV41_02830 [Microgenomates group bacterium]